MAKNVNAQDARLILQLAEMYREQEMQSTVVVAHLVLAEKCRRLSEARSRFGHPENVWLGQVTSYWGMAAALVGKGHSASRRCSELIFPKNYFKFSAKSSRFSRTFACGSTSPDFCATSRNWSWEARRAGIASPRCSNKLPRLVRKWPIAWRGQASGFLPSCFLC
jgi:hypothetical protein